MTGCAAAQHRFPCLQRHPYLQRVREPRAQLAMVVCRILTLSELCSPLSQVLSVVLVYWTRHPDGTADHSVDERRASLVLVARFFD